jgi:DNA (cytosine-5)-methyltransferase 1
MSRVILSLFPGVGLLDRAFEEFGWCVVRGPDLLWGGDVRRFEPPAGLFWGIIGGPPCQDFSAARRAAASGHGRQMLAEFRRVCLAAAPEWWLLENVPRVPDVVLPGYSHQRFALDQGWFEPVSRLRHFQFGARGGVLLDPPQGRRRSDCLPAALASDRRPWPVVRQLQGLPAEYDLPGWTNAGKIRAVGNGVPLCLGRAVAAAVAAVYGVGIRERAAAVSCERAALVCRCGCGRVVVGAARYAGAACRKRAERRRRRDYLECR